MRGLRLFWQLPDWINSYRFYLSFLNFLNYRAFVATFSKISRVSLAHFSQEKRFMFSNPLLTKSVLVLSSRALLTPLAIESTSFGSTNIPLVLTISGRLE